MKYKSYTDNQFESSCHSWLGMIQYWGVWNKNISAGEITQQLRSLAAILGIQLQISALIRWFTATIIPVPRDMISSSGLHGH